MPITEHTVFEIASMSKHLTVACMLLLVSDGKVDLDDDIRGMPPELALRHPVTLRHCFTHTAGLRDYLSLCELAGVPLAGIDEDRAMDLIAGQRDLDFPPGSAFSYSNSGYVLAAALVRKITGMSLAQFASERVFGPLGMAATAFRDDVGIPVPRLAGGYLAVPAGPQPNGFRRADVTENVVGDGGCVTSLADLDGWHAFMASGAVLGAEVRDGLFAEQTLTGGARPDTRSAWRRSRSAASGVVALGILGRLPERRDLPAGPRRQGVSVLANRNDRYASYVASAAATALVTGADARDCYAAVTGVPAPGEQASPAAEQVTGLWHSPALDLFGEFLAADGRIFVPDQDGGQVFCLATDGRWHGVGTASGGTCTQRGDVLAAGWGLSAVIEDRFVRADPGSLSDPGLPTGSFFSEELRAYASILADAKAEIAIGLARPRPVVPAGPGVWRAATGGALTVRLADDGSGLLISVPGAHHLAFSRSRTLASCRSRAGLATSPAW